MERRHLDLCPNEVQISDCPTRASISDLPPPDEI